MNIPFGAAEKLEVVFLPYLTFGQFVQLKLSAPEATEAFYAGKWGVARLGD